MIEKIPSLGAGIASKILMKDYVWPSNPLGPPDTWPKSLQTAAAITLGSRQPMFVAWGARRILIYNDAYSVLLGARHPSAFGRPFFDVWPELVGGEVEEMTDRVFRGDSIHMDDISLELERKGYPEETHFSFSYTPIPDDDGTISGLFCACTETTGTVLAQRLAASERERQRLLLQQMPGFVAVLRGPAHLYEYVNEAYVKIAGGRDLIGRNVRDVFPELREQGFLELLDQVYQTGEPFTANAIPIRLTGEDSDRFIDLLYQPVRDDRGDVTGIFVGGYDITDRVRAEEALRRSQASFRGVAEAMPGFVWTADAAGQVDYISPFWYAYTGSDPDESNGQGWNSFFHPSDQARALERWDAAVAAKAIYEIEFRLRRSDGVYRSWLARALPHEDGEDCLVRWVGVCVDIQDIVAAREALSRSRAELAGLVESRTRERDRVWRNSRDLLVVAGADGIVQAVSPAWTSVLGHDPADVAGRLLFDFIHQDDVAATRSAFADLAGQRGMAAFENRYRHRDGGYRWISWHTAVDDEVLYGYGRDVTEEKRQAGALLAAEEQLRQAQKMEAVGKLTGGIAHDFNNMLAVVIGSLDLLERRSGTMDARSRRYIDAASDGARRAALLTQRLLAFSRQQPLRPEPIDVNRLVAGMSDLLRHSLGGAVSLETVLAGGPWKTYADPNQLENAILNLAVNARDAMPDGGKLTIETQNAALDARYAASHPGVPPGQYVLIAVSDTGSGMTPEVIAKAFDPFFTTKDVGKGTGLGLSQVYGFIKQSSGHVKIYSEPGEGTTVKAYLPRHAATADEPLEPIVDRGGLAHVEHNELILVVEDEPAVRQFSVDALTELGYRVLEADGAKAALRQLGEHADIALLFTDVVMPDVNGRKLADEVRRLRPDMRILFTTGYTRNAVVHNGVLDPGVALIGKPFTIEELAAMVRQVLDCPPG